ncbi:MAG: anthranilate phosphoribosyltransferase [Acidimicrobiales bacterium]|nr:anthranilate phosphoribosyltransferase [Acidimicrobiales bacterium]
MSAVIPLDWSALLGTIAAGEHLTRADTAEAMREVLQGDADPVALGALLMGLRVKGESDEEILGFADAMLEAAEPLIVPEGTVDIVGTGGSKHRQAHALNVSTMASFVAAAAGATICKHGNVKASSTSGSFDFLAAIGVDINGTPADIEQQLATHGLAFAWAKTFHPAMRHAGPVRSALGLPTVFNILGPLVHPGHVKRVVLGAATVERAEQLARILTTRNMACAWVVAGYEGLDELSTLGPNDVFEVVGADITHSVVTPGDLGLQLASPKDLRGGSGDENARIFYEIISPDFDRVPDDASAAADIVVLNAGAALVVAGVAVDLTAGTEAAAHALSSGAVEALYEAFTSPV